MKIYVIKSVEGCTKKGLSQNPGWRKLCFNFCNAAGLDKILADNTTYWSFAYADKGKLV